MDEDAIHAELDAAMRHLMGLSRQRKIVGHKSLATDKGSWKLGRSHSTTHTDKLGIKYDVYRCPMRHQCKCGVADL